MGDPPPDGQAAVPTRGRVGAGARVSEALAWLHAVRAAEIDAIRDLLPGSGRLLELGAGTGYQAKLLADLGHDVTAVDLEGSSYAGARVFPVLDYDGTHLPLASQSIDVVFSSNVLEHVKDPAALAGEMRRVLAPGGFGLHLVPTPAWRFWTTLAGPLDIPLLFVKRGATRPGKRQPLVRAVLGRLWPQRHGEYGSAWSELARFRADAWRARFVDWGFDVVTMRPGGLFYTGYTLLGARLSFARRRAMASVLGSACTVFLVKSRTPTTPS